MKGFGYCLWWKIKNHPINHITKRLSNTFRTPTFAPHISIRTNFGYVPTELIFPERHDNVQTFQYRLYDSSVRIPSWNTTFHALEIPVAGHFLSYKSHVSVAYRLHTPFTQDEIEQAERIIAQYHFDTILYECIDVGVYDCSSIHPGEWFCVTFAQDFTV